MPSIRLIVMEFDAANGDGFEQALSRLFGRSDGLPGACATRLLDSPAAQTEPAAEVDSDVAGAIPPAVDEKKTTQPDLEVDDAPAPKDHHGRRGKRPQQASVWIATGVEIDIADLAVKLGQGRGSILARINKAKRDGKIEVRIGGRGGQLYHLAKPDAGDAKPRSRSDTLPLNPARMTAAEPAPAPRPVWRHTA